MVVALLVFICNYLGTSKSLDVIRAYFEVTLLLELTFVRDHQEITLTRILVRVLIFIAASVTQ